MNMKHKIGDIWKDDLTNQEPYSVQFPRHIEGAKNRKEAEEKSRIARALNVRVKEEQR